MAPRVALIAGLRTPFARRGGAFRDRGALDLGVACVTELLTRTGLAGEIERVVYGQVVPSLTAPNIARELALDAGLPTVDAYSVTRACTTSYQAAIDLTHAIVAGDVDAGVCGGADSVSDVPVAVPRRLGAALIEISSRGRPRLRTLAELRPRDLVPEPPALTERTTGLTMGEHAEQMAAANRIGRAAQDELAARSHARAAAAWADGRFAEEVMALPGIDRDATVRAETSVATLARLRPVFGQDGAITAGNASPLSDGASAAILMREDKARALGLAPLAFVRATATTAVDPRGQMLLGPAYAIPRALERAGATLADLTLLDLHEAFAAQVLSVTQALASPAWAAEHLGRAAAVGEVDWDRTNVCGGSIAIGHPFAATGTRQLVQVARELRRRGGGLGLLSACAAGGLAAAIVLESAP